MGFVAHQQRRTIHDGSGDRNALLFAAGKLVGALIELVLQANETQDLGNLRLDDVAAFPDYLERECNVFENGLVRQEFEVLENAADIAAQIGHAPVTHRAQILARDEDMAVGGLQLARDQFDKRGFARSGMTYQKDEFSRIDLQGNVMQGGLVGLCGVHFGHMVECDNGSSHGLLLHIFHGKRGQRSGQVGKTAVLPGAFEWLPLCTGAEPGVFTGGMAPVA